MPKGKHRAPSGSRLLLWLTYALLVGIVAWLSFHIETQLDKAEQERCNVAVLTFYASGGQERLDRQLARQYGADEAQQRSDALTAELEDLCGVEIAKQTGEDQS